MATRTFTSNTTINFGLDAKCEIGYRVLSYTGALGGGTLQVFTKAGESANLVPVPDSKLAAATVDGAGDVRRQLVFQSSGAVSVTLSGATDPNVEVSVE